ncbi:hypothetical protein [Seohaeicola zhoushanensis]|uniref:hypothetical protein n=1 Tax=Seohaeicola zhoushanensis TaxID=1569283 RepID=UPI001677AC27|nr:hypothetical protein [Seohaeicola zhoushanensis]
MEKITVTTREAGNSDDLGFDEPVEDYSIYLHKDGLRPHGTPPWRLGNYGETGALSEGMNAHLCAAFDFDEDIVRRLSVELGHCLNNDDDVLVNLFEVNRLEAIKRAQPTLKRLKRFAKAQAISPARLRDHLTGLSTQFAPTPEVASLLPELIAELDGAEAIAPGIVAAIDLILETPGSAADMSPLDKRATRDKRRQYIVETCCYAWQDAGRRVTYTTVSDGSKVGQRHGKLLEFIQAVAMMVTAPSTELNGETVRKDIDRFTNDPKDNVEDWGPPEFGNQY